MDLLHDDALKTVGEYAGKLYGAEAYVRFAQTCRRTRRLLLSPDPDGGRENRTIRAVIECRSRPSHRRPPAVPTSAPYGIHSLEQLALFERWSDADFLRDNRIVFPFASTEIEPEMQARVLEIADIMVRYPRVSLRLDSHCGTVAPSGVDDWFSRARGLSLRNAICYDGNAFPRRMKIDQRRVNVVGWGKRVANLVVQSGHPFRDVAGEGLGWVEVYLEVPGRREGDGEMVLPPRHRYYYESFLDSTISDRISDDEDPFTSDTEDDENF